MVSLLLNSALQASLQMLVLLVESEVYVTQPILDCIIWCLLALVGFLCDHRYIYTYIDTIMLLLCVIMHT